MCDCLDVIYNAWYNIGIHTGIMAQLCAPAPLLFDKYCTVAVFFNGCTVATFSPRPPRFFPGGPWCLLEGPYRKTSQKSIFGVIEPDFFVFRVIGKRIAKSKLRAPLKISHHRKIPRQLAKGRSGRAQPAPTFPLSKSLLPHRQQDRRSARNWNFQRSPLELNFRA